MLELAVAASRAGQTPAIRFDHLNHVANLHRILAACSIEYSLRLLTARRQLTTSKLIQICPDVRRLRNGPNGYSALGNSDFAATQTGFVALPLCFEADPTGRVTAHVCVVA